MKRTYKHLFFDLDHTLWDHHSNANETLHDLYREYDLQNLYDFTIESFQGVFHEVNHSLWDDYHLGHIDQTFIREQRFKKVLKVLEADGFDQHQELGNEYLVRCPRKSNLMPFALEALDYLKDRYPMTVITNGFAEIQDIKLESSGLTGYFREVITSERAGWLKPHQGIFNYALKMAGVSSSESVMVGDNPATDVEGARGAGIDQIYYDPSDRHTKSTSTYKISSLLELKELL